jgi:hypothetical protein
VGFVSAFSCGTPASSIESINLCLQGMSDQGSTEVAAIN